MLEMGTRPQQPQRVPEPWEDEWPDGWPRHARDGRPKIRRADDPTRFAFYRRPSSFADGVESTFLLDRREDCLMLVACQRFPHLLDETAAALALADGDPLESDRCKSALRAVRSRALELAGANVKAARGTAIHKLWERKLAGADLSFVLGQTWEAVLAYERLLADFVVHAVELRVVNDEHETAGTTDVVVSPRWPMTFELPRGPVTITPDDVLIGDGKSGEHVAELGRVARAVQLYEYAASTPYEHVSDEYAAAGEHGRQPWVCGPPRRDVALVFHVPQDHPQDAGVVALDLRPAKRLADLAHGIWAARALRPSDLFVPVEIGQPPMTASVVCACPTCTGTGPQGDVACMGARPVLEMGTAVECEPDDGPELPPGRCTVHEVAQVACDDCSAAQVTRLAACGAQVGRRRAFLELQITNARVAHHLDWLKRTYHDVWTGAHDAMLAAKVAELRGAGS